MNLIIETIVCRNTHNPFTLGLIVIFVGAFVIDLFYGALTKETMLVSKLCHTIAKWLYGSHIGLWEGRIIGLALFTSLLMMPLETIIIATVTTVATKVMVTKSKQTTR